MTSNASAVPAQPAIGSNLEPLYTQLKNLCVDIRGRQREAAALIVELHTAGESFRDIERAIDLPGFGKSWAQELHAWAVVHNYEGAPSAPKVAKRANGRPHSVDDSNVVSLNGEKLTGAQVEAMGPKVKAAIKGSADTEIPLDEAKSRYEEPAPDSKPEQTTNKSESKQTTVDPAEQSKRILASCKSMLDDYLPLMRPEDRGALADYLKSHASMVGVKWRLGR